jgi:hypothetical protein
LLPIRDLPIQARSLLQEQSTPVGTLVFDRSSSVSQAAKLWIPSLQKKTGKNRVSNQQN